MAISNTQEFLKDYICPNCENENKTLDFYCKVNVVASVNGDSLLFPLFPLEDEYCQCKDCGFFGKLKDFKIKKKEGAA